MEEKDVIEVDPGEHESSVLSRQEVLDGFEIIRNYSDEDGEDDWN